MADRMLGQAAEPYPKRTNHTQRRESQRLKAVTTREQRSRERRGWRLATEDELAEAAMASQMEEETPK